MYENYSVLMSVYIKEKPEFLRESMQSIYDQTIPTDDFILICDGPLTEELNDVIEEMHNKFQNRLRVHRLNNNVGLGNALNVGVRLCKNELVARMDSDDISKSFRCEQQINKFKEFSELAIVSATIEEFGESPEKLDNKKILPETHEQILEYAKHRNPFNHPCVMYKKSSVIQAGGYQDFYLLEDYYLWIRMLLRGLKGYNIQETLLLMRTGAGLYNRRSGGKYALSQMKLFRYMYKNNFISFYQCIVSIITRGIVALIPNKARVFIYQHFLRK